MLSVLLLIAQRTIGNRDGVVDGRRKRNRYTRFVIEDGGMIGIPGFFLLIMAQSSEGCVNLRGTAVVDLLEDYARWRNLNALAISWPCWDEAKSE